MTQKGRCFICSFLFGWSSVRRPASSLEPQAFSLELSVLVSSNGVPGARRQAPGAGCNHFYHVQYTLAHQTLFLVAFSRLTATKGVKLAAHEVTSLDSF